MSRATLLTVLAFVPAVFHTTPAAAGGETSWVTFQDQTATRIDTSQDPNSAPNVVLNNPDEKDYAWGDLDNDGDIDLVAVYKQPETTTGRRRNVLLMNEIGVLVDRTTQYATASTVMLADGSASQGFLDLTNDRDVAVVDVNGDGWLDIVTATTLSGNPDGTIGDKAISHPRIYVNLGDDPPGSGNWQGLIFDDVDRVPTMPAEPRFLSVSFGDIDDDGDDDLYLTDHQQGPYGRPVDLNNRLWINDGTGVFADESTLRMTNAQRIVSMSSSSAIADMNVDGALDVVFNSMITSPVNVSIVYNDPTNEGFFQTMPRDVVYSMAPYHMSVGDLNDDDLLDIVVTDANEDRYILNLGNGADGLADFDAPTILIGSLGIDEGGNSNVADLNQDGLNDVLVASMDVDDANCAQLGRLFRNFGLHANGFSVGIAQDGNAGIAQAHLNGVHDFAVFDINGDTWLDLVIGRCSGTNVYMNQAIVPCTGFGDMNADGDLDGRDIPGFAECYINQAPACNCADANDDQAITDFDLQRFVFELLTGP